LTSRFVTNQTAETLEPDVKMTSLSILSTGRPDMVLPLPPEPKSKEPWFTLKEGSAYRLKFTFAVAGNIVSGLRYTNTVWKTGIRGNCTPSC
jgi:Rho GDP-dissociation inhibitor